MKVLKILRDRLLVDSCQALKSTGDFLFYPLAGCRGRRITDPTNGGQRGRSAAVNAYKIIACSSAVGLQATIFQKFYCGPCRFLNSFHPGIHRINEMPNVLLIV